MDANHKQTLALLDKARRSFNRATMGEYVMREATGAVVIIRLGDGLVETRPPQIRGLFPLGAWRSVAARIQVHAAAKGEREFYPSYTANSNFWPRTRNRSG